jgi:hypothetical protein
MPSSGANGRALKAEKPVASIVDVMAMAASTPRIGQRSDAVISR